jgi:voltage-gated potassium channel
MPKLISEKAHFIEADATEEGSLLAAGVERARGLISVAPSDADNTFITLTAKGLNPNLFVVARSIKAEDEPKLRRAGADRVMSPYILGGKRMAWAVLRPAVVDFLDTAMYSESLELEIGEVTVSPRSEFINKKLRDSGIREQSGANVIAIRSMGGTLRTSPAPDMEVRQGDVLIVVGTPAQLEVLQRIA